MRHNYWTRKYRSLYFKVIVMKLSPLKPKSSVGHNSHTVCDMIILGRDQ